MRTHCTYLWFNCTDIESEINRCSCSWDRFSSRWNAPFDTITIPVAEFRPIFTYEIHTIQPVRTPFPSLNDFFLKKKIIKIIYAIDILTLRLI